MENAINLSGAQLILELLRDEVVAKLIQEINRIGTLVDPDSPVLQDAIDGVMAYIKTNITNIEALQEALASLNQEWLDKFVNDNELIRSINEPSPSEYVFTRSDGSTVTISLITDALRGFLDLDLETGELVFERQDGTEARADISALLTQYVGMTGTQIQVTVNGAEISATLLSDSVTTAHIQDGAITLAKLAEEVIEAIGQGGGLAEVPFATPDEIGGAKMSIFEQGANRMLEVELENEDIQLLSPASVINTLDSFETSLPASADAVRRVAEGFVIESAAGVGFSFIDGILRTSTNPVSSPLDVQVQPNGTVDIWINP